VGRNQSRKDHSSSPAMEQSWMENDFDGADRVGFKKSRYNKLFSELKEDVRTHRKGTKNLKKIRRMPTRMNEKGIKKRVKRNEQSLQEIWDYVEMRPKSKLENTLQDIIQENFPNLARQANIQIQEIQRTPQRYSSRRATPRHIIVRFTKVEMKEKMLRPIRLTADLLAETLQARREWGPIFNILFFSICIVFPFIIFLASPINSSINIRYIS
uniref:Uncharacterized protein n=1 Tax=Astyanax mexicanus TaxID=7994 RepID=A0A3B1KIC1_ASTMX